MLSRIISSKLAAEGRIVVPNLGIFIVGNDGRIRFSELMRHDDGVLRAAVENAKAVGGTDADAMIARFVSDVRAALEHGTSYRLEGFGALQRNEHGTAVFVGMHSHTEAPSAVEPTQTVGEREPEAVAHEVSREVPQSPKQHEAEEAGRHVAPRPKAAKPRGGADIFMITAIVVALVALGVIAYGFLQAKARGEIDTVPERTEQTTAEGDETPEESAPAEETQAKEVKSEIVDLSVPSGK